MKRRTTKIEQASSSLFRPGNVALALVMIAIFLEPLSRTNLWTDWLATICFALFGFKPTHDLLFGLSGLAAYIIGFYGISLSNKYKINSQPLRDRTIYESTSYAVFLRPFFTDKLIKFPNPHYRVTGGMFSLEQPSLGAEEFVGRLLEPYIDVVEIGGVADSIGPARLYGNESNWQLLFQKYCHDADVVILLPLLDSQKADGHQPGSQTMWELHQLKLMHKLDRTIILMPKSNFLSRNWLRPAWERARTHAAEFSVVLPKYDSAGGIYAARSDNSQYDLSRRFTGGYRWLYREWRFAGGLVEAYKHIESQIRRAK